MAPKHLQAQAHFKPGVVLRGSMLVRAILDVLFCSCRRRDADADTSAVDKRARIEGANNGVSEAGHLQPHNCPVEAPSSKVDERAGDSKTLSSVLDRPKESNIDKGKYRDRHEKVKRRDDRRSYASKERYALAARPTSCVSWTEVHLPDKCMPSACPLACHA